MKNIIINDNIIEVTSQEETINLLVERIKAMPNGKEFTISQLIDQEIESVIPITIDTLKKLKEFGITVKSKLDSNAITGLPQDAPYIKINNN